MPSASCEGWTQNGPTWNGWNERWFSATQSFSGSSSHVQLADRSGHGSVALAEDLDAPRPVARDLAAGDDEAVLGEMLQRLLRGEALVGRDDPPGLPDLLTPPR